MAERASKRALAVLARFGELQAPSPYQYVTIHPLADETAILARLRMRPEDCVSVDCYWAVGDAVFFVSVLAKPDGSAFAAYRPGDADPVDHYFHVVTQQRPLTGPIYESILGGLEAWYGANQNLLPKEQTVLTMKDLGIPPA